MGKTKKTLSKTQSEIKAGSLVELRSGGPTMTVVQIIDDVEAALEFGEGKAAICKWFECPSNEEGWMLNTAEISVVALKLVDSFDSLD